MSRETRIISVANSKGGVGKSVVTILLATTLAKYKKRKVLILDCDSQGSISEMYAREKELYEDEPLVEVEDLTPRRVNTFLKRFAADYDVIFIDVPRMTDGKKDNATVMLLQHCDAIFVPVIGSEVDVLSTSDFINIVQDTAAYKDEMGEPFKFYGFINRRNLRKSNEEAEAAMKKRKLKMFKNSLADLKIFTQPSFFTSVMDYAEGARRFEPFYKEFVRKFKL